MKNMWNEEKARNYAGDVLAVRAYTSRLLGQDKDLVLCGGGNTSVKIDSKTGAGEYIQALFIKASGQDLANIQPDGFVPVQLDKVKQLLSFEALTDTELITAFRTALIAANAPTPSIETILHSIIPYTFVEHTHADAIVAITNTPDGNRRIREIYGNSVIIVPYVASGFQLAKTVHLLTGDIDWNTIKGIILLHHGIVTFHTDARTSYERMVELVSKAEEYLTQYGAYSSAARASEPPKPVPVELIKRIGDLLTRKAGFPIVTVYNDDSEARGFISLPRAGELAKRGLLIPGHLPIMKRMPIIIRNGSEDELEEYISDYRVYFEKYSDGSQVFLESLPKWGIAPGYGLIAFGKDIAEAQTIMEVARHTIRAIQWCEALGGWQPLSEKFIFDAEFRLFHRKFEPTGG
jgi:rhamnose utilization protein RhaD (predicted bifunctional aldolase and dehydrogenase)